MAISFDASSSGSTTDTSLTFSHTCTGSNLILFISARTNNNATVTGITYNSVAMTRIATGTVNPISSRYVTLFYLLSPATGAHDIVISLSGSDSVGGHGLSYTGALQSGVPDASDTTSVTGTSSTNDVTTVANNCWIVTTHANSEADSVGTTNITDRIGTGGYETGDYGPKTPAGAITLTWDFSPTTVNDALVAGSFAPAPEEISGSYGFFM